MAGLIDTTNLGYCQECGEVVDREDTHILDWEGDHIWHDDCYDRKYGEFARSLVTEARTMRDDEIQQMIDDAPERFETTDDVPF